MNITSILVSFNAALIFANTALAQLPISDVTQSIAGFAIGIALAFIGPLLPKVSGNFRSFLGLQRRG